MLVEGQGQQAVHDGAAALQVLDGLEERDQVQIQPPIGGAQEARLPQEHGGLQEVRHALGVAHDAAGQGLGAQAPLGCSHRMEERQLGAGLLAVGQEGCGQGAGALQLHRQQGDALLLLQGQVVGARLHHRQQLGHHAAVDLGGLAQVQGYQVEAEHRHGAAQVPQAAPGQTASPVGPQRAVQGVQVGLQLGGRGVGGQGLGGGGQVFGQQALAGGFQAGGDGGLGQPVGLVGPLGRAVGGLVRQVQDFLRGLGYLEAEGQLRAQGLQLSQEEVQDGAGLHLQGAGQHLGGDEGVAVPVPADPAAQLQEGRQLRIPPGRIQAQAILQVGIEGRDFAQKGALEVGQGAGHLVRHGGPVGAQHAGLPEQQHLALQVLVPQGILPGRGHHAVALFQQAGDLHLGVQDALALDLGGVGREHRAHLGSCKEFLQPGGIQAGGGAAGQRMAQGAGAGWSRGGSVGPGAADVVLVLRQVGQLREVAEGPDH